MYCLCFTFIFSSLPKWYYVGICAALGTTAGLKVPDSDSSSTHSLTLRPCALQNKHGVYKLEEGRHRERVKDNVTLQHTDHHTNSILTASVSRTINYDLGKASLVIYDHPCPLLGTVNGELSTTWTGIAMLAMRLLSYKFTWSHIKSFTYCHYCINKISFRRKR